MTTTAQLLSNISTCSPKVIGNLLTVLQENVGFLVKFQIAPREDQQKEIDPSSLLKTFEVNGKSYTNNLSQIELSIVAELSTLLNIEPKQLLKFFSIVSNKLIKSNDYTNDFKLIESDNKSRFDNGKDQLTNFYISQYIGEISSVYKLLALLLKDSLRAESYDILNNEDAATMKSIVATVDKSVPVIIESSISTIQTVVEKLTSLKDSDDQLSNLIKAQLSNLLLDILNSIETALVYSSNGFSINSIVEWFKLTESTEYFTNVIDDLEKLITLQSLSTVIGLSFFDLEFNYGSLDDYSFMNSAKDLNKITELILSTDSNPIILYAWSIILHRKQTVLEMFPEDPKSIEFQSELNNGPLREMKDVYTSLAINAEKLDVSNALLRCNNSISYEESFTNVIGTFVVIYIPYIQPTEKIVDTISTILKSSSNSTIEKFFCSESVEELMILLKAKMPLSLDMFVSLISINANLAIEELNSLSSYMHLFDTKTFNLKYSIDDQQPELINLTSNVQILPPFEREGELCLVMGEGTKGQIISTAQLDNQSLVVFLYEYNGWSLIGRVIKNLSINLLEEDIKFKTIERLISLLTVVINGSNNFDVVLKSLNEYLDDFDLIDVIFRILDQSLTLKHTKTVSIILEFLDALTNNGYAHRVWSYIYKSDLFSSKQNIGLIADILGKAEIPSGEFDTTISLFQLGLSLLSDSLKFHENVSTKLKSHVLNQIVLHGVRIFEHLITWNFKYSYQRFKLGFLISKFFNKILIIHNGVKDYEYNYSKINEVLNESFETLANIFLIQYVEDVRTISFILHTLYNSNLSYSTISSNDLSGNWVKKWQLSSLELCTNLIKVRSSLAPEQPSTLEVTFYKSVKGLVNIYIFDESLKKPILRFLKQLVVNNWGANNQPSLLTHLGTSHTQLFLQALHNDMSNEFNDDELLILLYDLFSSIMKNNQEGLSIVLITGKCNINSIETIKNEDSNLSLFEVLKNALQNYKDYPSMVLLHILDSLSSLLTTWNGGLIKSDDTTFINKVLELALKPKIEECRNPIELVYNYKLKSKIVEILSLSLGVYHGKNKKCEDLINSKLNDELFIKELPNVFQVAEFDITFKNEIRNKFNLKFGDRYSLDQFIVNNVHKSNDFDVDLKYNFELLDHLFKFDEDWLDIKRDIVKSNMNELLTDSQLSLADSYNKLVTNYCNLNPLIVNQKYLQIARDLLNFTVEEQAISKSNGDFKKFYVSRITLSFLICFTISKADSNTQKIDKSIILSIITSSSQLLESESLNLIEELTTLDVTYSNPLLKILLLSIRMIDNDDNQLVIENSTTFIDIWMNVICKGLNIIFSSIRNKAISIPNHEYGDDKLILKQIDDIKLIFQLLEKFLTLNFNSAIELEIAKITIESNVFNSIINLFGISHLIKINDDDIFGDLSLLFILEMAKNKLIAEKFVSKGIFQILNESTISLMIQRGHITPYVNDMRINRLHQLWVERILPIMLTLIGHFKESIMFDICKFVITFKNQIGFTIHTWLETDTLISPIVIEETEQIIMFAKILNSFDCYNFISIEMNKPVNEVKLIPGLDTIEERRDFVNVINYLLSHPKYLSSKVRTFNKDVPFEDISNSIFDLKELILN